MKSKQRGFFDIPRGFLETLFALAAVGALSLLGWCIYGIYWLVKHIAFI